MRTPGPERPIRALVLSVALLAGTLGGTAAGAQATTFPVPPSFIGTHGLSLGPDHNVWFVDPGGPRIGRITPSGASEGWTIPSASAEGGDTVAGPDGKVWFTVQCNLPCTFAIGRIDPAAPDPGATIQLFTAPSLAFPASIVAGPDGLIWWVNLASSSFGHLDPNVADPQATIVEVPGGPDVLNPPDLTVGPDGNLWFTSANDRVGRVTPAGVVSTWDASAAGGSELVGIAPGPDGLLWFTSFLNMRLGTIDPLAADPGATITTFGDPRLVGPTAIVRGPDDALWFLDTSASVAQIGRVTIDRAFSLTPSPGAANAALAGLAVGADCALWFGISQPIAIGRLNTGVTCTPPVPLVPAPLVLEPTFTG